MNSWLQKIRKKSLTLKNKDSTKSKLSTHSTKECLSMKTVNSNFLVTVINQAQTTAHKLNSLNSQVRKSVIKHIRLKLKLKIQTNLIHQT